MKYTTIVITILAIALIVFNDTKLDFDALFKGESFTAIITIIAGLCAILLLQILRLSKKVDSLHQRKK
ncbi:MAG: hypothetical protein AAF901_14575 [Bacteroidota bacterium]